MPVKINKVKKVKELLPWEDDPSEPVKPKQTLLQALGEYVPKGKRRLFVLHNQTSTEYEVKGWDAATRRAQLLGPNHAKLKPFISEREDALYTPVWR